MNMGRSYELTSAEVFYLNQKEKQAQQLTCVGTVCVKAYKQCNTQALFDLCSSDNWILDSFAKQIKAKEVGKFNGMITTITGSKKCILPKYSISLLKDDDNWVEITAIGISNIGWKPSIEHIRFKRLTQAFQIPMHQVENG